MNSSRDDLEALIRDMKPEAIPVVDAVYGFNLSGEGGGKFTMDIRVGATKRLLEGMPADHQMDSEVTILCSAEHFHAIVEGSMKANAALMFGRLKVIGNMGAALKLSNVF